MKYICQTCRKSRAELISENKLNLVQGYEQCADCYADLEYESVVMISDLLTSAKKQAEDNDDYTVSDMNPELVKIARISDPNFDGKSRVLNSTKYLPEWYKKELHDRHQKTHSMFSGMHETEYNEVID